MNPDQHAVRLNYASPRIFFAREYRHRSANAALGIVALLLFTVFFGWGAYTGYRRTGSHWFSAPIAIMCGTTLFGAAWMIRRWWLNDHRRRRDPWAEAMVLEPDRLVLW